MRRHLSFLNIVAAAAIFIVLGGGAYAASQLPKNSVTSKQIKNKSVKAKDLGKNAVGSKQLKANAVSGPKVANDSLKGEDIDESTLSTVDAARVGGSQVQQISYAAGPNTAAQTVFSVAGLTVTAACPAPGDDYVELTATTDTANSILGVGGFGPGGVANDFDPGEPEVAQLDDIAATLAYGRGASSSPVVSANFLANQYAGGGGECKVVGTIVTNG
jgi:hypothetical protein